MQTRAVSSEDELILESDAGATGQPGDIVFKTSGVERTRLTAAGSATSWPGNPLMAPSMSFTQAGSVVAGNGPYWLCGAGNVLYASVTNDSKIKAYDISAANGVPVLLGQVTVGTNTGWMEKAGKYLYATDVNGGALRAIDVSNPASPSVAQTLSVNGDGNGLQGRFGIQVRGNLMCIGGPAAGASTGTVYIIDFSVPTACAVVGSVALSGVVNCRGVVSIGASYFAVASRDDATVRIIDASVPTAPVQVASIATTQSNTTAALQAQGRYLYVGNYGNGITGGLEVWDLAVPSQPVQAGVLSIPGGCEQMLIRGGYLYIGHRPNTTPTANCFTVIEIRNPALPKLLATVQAGADQTPGIAVQNGYVYRSSSESNGNLNGLVYAVAMSDNYARRISAIEDFMQLRPPNIV